MAEIATTLLPLITTGGSAAAGTTAGTAATASFMAGSTKAAQLAAMAGGTSAGITGMQALGLGLSAGSSILGGISALNQAQIYNNNLARQEARDRLNLVEAEKESQRRLRESLAAQNVYYGAVGIDPSSGSALAAAEAAKRQGDDQLSLYAAQRELSQGRSRRGKGAVIAKSLLDFGTSTTRF